MTLSAQPPRGKLYTDLTHGRERALWLRTMQKCTAPFCGKLGATLGCIVATCQQNYHQPCAVEIGCHLNWSTFNMHCPEHVAHANGGTMVRPCLLTPSVSIMRLAVVRWRLELTGHSLFSFDTVGAQPCALQNGGAKGHENEQEDEERGGRRTPARGRRASSGNRRARPPDSPRSPPSSAAVAMLPLLPQPPLSAYAEDSHVMVLARGGVWEFGTVTTADTESLTVTFASGSERAVTLSKNIFPADGPTPGGSSFTTPRASTAQRASQRGAEGAASQAADLSAAPERAVECSRCHEQRTMAVAEEAKVDWARWTCAQCLNGVFLKGRKVERVLGSRMRPGREGDGDEKTSEAESEVCVKFVGVSYRAVEWLPQRVVEQVSVCACVCV